MAKKDKQPELHEIEGVEIFRVGVWNGDKFTKADLDAMVDAFGKAGFQVPIKLGHEERSGDRAFGWIKTLKRVGDKLIADFMDVPESVFKVIRDRGFDAVSAEIFFNLKRAGQTFRRALKAVALLGAEIPAVAGLKPLREVAFDAGDYEAIETVTMHKETEAMADDKQVAELTAAKEKAETEVTEKDKALEASQAETAELKQKLEAAEKGKGEADAEIKALTAKGEASDKRIAAIEEDRRKERVDGKITKLLVPAMREHFTALYQIATGTEVKTFAIGDQKELVAEAVVDSLLGVVNDRAVKLFGENGGTSIDRPDGAANEDAGAEVHARVEKFQAEHKDTAYSVALAAVLAADPELKAAYAAS